MYNQKPKEKKRDLRVRKTKLQETEEETAQQRLKRMRKSEKLISQEINETVKSDSSFNTSVLANLSLDSIKSDHENAELEIEWSAAGQSTRERKSAAKDKITIKQLSPLERSQVLSGLTLLNIIYCALNICGSDFQLSDLIRFIREGHLSYFNLRRFLPDDITEADVPLSFVELHSYRMISYDNLIIGLASFVRIIPDLVPSFCKPSISVLARRFIDDLSLPHELGDFVDRLVNFLPPEMRFRSQKPNYEGRAMAFVLFVLKLFFGIDGYREKEISESACLINHKILPNQLIFVYEDWRKFIEYRQVILGKYYYPSMLFQPEVPEDRPYMAFNLMLDTLKPKTRSLEAQNVNVHNEKRMQSKKNATEMLTEMTKNHKEDMKFHFAVSLTPHKDNFQTIKNSVKLNSKIVNVDYSSHSLEAFLNPQKFAAAEGIELQTQTSTFPKCYAFTKPTPSSNQLRTNRRAFEMETEGVETWNEKLKQRREIEDELKESNIKEFHWKQMERVLERRKYWRQEKRSKITFGKKVAEYLGEPDESQVFSDFEDDVDIDVDNEEISRVEDAELESLFQSHQQPKLTFIVPDFNMWQRSIMLQEICKQSRGRELEKLPSSFRWLLNLAASSLHQNPSHIYRQLICVENQFMHVYQPIELMKNVLLRQKTPGGKIYKTVMKSLEEDW